MCGLDGEQLNNKPIDFKLMKITHNPKSKNRNVSTCTCYAPSHLHHCSADMIRLSIFGK